MPVPPPIVWVLVVAAAVYAPVASRFRTYAIPLRGEAAVYAATVLALPDVEEWHDAAAAESATLEEYDRMQ